MAHNVSVAVLGACGRMGREVVRAISEAPDTDLVAVCDVACVGQPAAQACGVPGVELLVEGDFPAMLGRARPDVVIDFAKPFSMENALAAMKAGSVPIIGTTGQTPQQLQELEQSSLSLGAAVMVIPNFAIGAVLMMMFAAQAARYLPNAEIIELHHDRKLDAPSGTSIKTAEMIDEARRGAGMAASQPAGGDDPARGEKRSGVQVHSVRLPGLVAHQEVIFGDVGQVLTIRHDSIDRTSFMPGVLLAVRKAASVSGLIYGLDRLL